MDILINNRENSSEFQEKIKMIETILESFDNEDIKEFTVQVVNDMPLYWWHIAASSTGKYHPTYSLDDGGLLRHSIAVVRLLNWFFELEQYQSTFSSRQRDLIRLAGLVHDGRKSGPSDEAKSTYTVFEHPILMADAIRSYTEEDWISTEEIEYIALAIISHMGQFNTSSRSEIALPKPITESQKLVHLADYLASRKSLIMEFENFVLPPLPDINDYVLEFGKYKGKTLLQIKESDYGYIDWLKENYGKDPVRRLVKSL